MPDPESASPTELLSSYLAVPYQSLDRTGTIQAVNEAWTELLGYDESRLGTPFAELLGDDARERFQTWLAECERSPPPRKLPLDITNAAGHTRTVELSGRVEASETDNLDRIHCQLHDITEYQRNRQNFRTYREAVENSGHSIFWTDTEGHIEYVNPVFEAITGYSAEEVIGETPSLLSSGVHDDSFYDDLWGTIKAGNVWQGEIINERKSGEQYVVWQTISPITDDAGEITRYVAVNHDITDRKLREQRLELKTETTEHAPIGIVLTDPTTDLNQVVYANDGFSELTGYTRSEILGRSCRLLYGDKTAPETVATIEDHVGNNQPVTERVTHHRKSGTPFWTLLTIVPIRDHNRTVVYHARFFRDITTRRTQLRHLQMIDRVLRHNLRNDLNVVQAWAEKILHTGTTSDGTAVAAAEQIVQTATSLATKVEKERKITRLLGTGTEPELLEITSACHTAVETAQEEYPAFATTLTLPDEVFVEAIPEIRSALIELVRNAVEHNDAETPQVSIEVTTESETVRITVSDNGPGIPEMETNILTNDDTITPLYHGSGLGLWFVHLVVRKSEGDISVKVDDSRGSRVELVLPTPTS